MSKDAICNHVQKLFGSLPTRLVTRRDGDYASGKPKFIARFEFPKGRDGLAPKFECLAAMSEFDGKKVYRFSPYNLLNQRVEVVADVPVDSE